MHRVAVSDSQVQLPDAVHARARIRSVLLPVEMKTLSVRQVNPRQLAAGKD